LIKICDGFGLLDAMGDAKTDNCRKVPQRGQRAREIAGGEGIDDVVDVAGRATLPQSLRAVRAGGTISLIGAPSGGNMDVPLGPVVTRHVRLQGVTVDNRDDFTKMAAAMEQHKLEPVIDRIFAFEDLRGALDYLLSGRHFGKICIQH
jgi:NADPH:quinone reductase-like Zn-dependent oxidoreductase